MAPLRTCIGKQPGQMFDLRKAPGLLTVTSIFVTFVLQFPEVLSGAGKNIEQTSSLNVALMLLGFIAFSFLLEKGLHILKHHLQHTEQIGLLNALEKIQMEILLVGMISLFLLTIEDDLLRICVDEGNEFRPINRAQCAGLYSSSSSSSSTSSSSSATCNCTTRRMLSDGTVIMETAEYVNPHIFQQQQTSDTIGTHTSFRRRRRLLASDAHECPSGKMPFVDAAALHDIHYLIFFTASVHITYSLCVYFFGRWHTKKWVDWEKMELNDQHHLLHKHQAINLKTFKKSCCVDWLIVILKQWTARLDYTSFVSVRKFYVVKNGLKPNFKFYHFVDVELQRDFGQLAGISWWMWILLALQVFVEGVMEKPLSYGSTLAMILSTFIGCKMIVAAKTIAVKILTKYDKDGNGMVNPEELMEAKNQKRTKESLDDVEPHFWFDRPWVMGVFLKGLMFQNAISVATGMFYVLYFGQKSNCYMKSRSWTDVFVSTGIGLVVLFHHGTVLLPNYALVMHLGNHRELNDYLSRLHEKAGKRWSKIIGSKKHGKGHDKSHGHGGSKVHPGVDALAAVREEFGADSQEYKDALNNAANVNKKNEPIDTRTMEISTSRTENQVMDAKKKHDGQ